MMQPSASLSWIVVLCVVVVVVGVVLGAALSHTDFFNFNTSAAEMRAMDEATDAKAQTDAVDQRVYEARKEVEITAQQQLNAFQAVKNSIDQQVYRIQQTAQAMKTVADARQYEAQQLAQAEAERQRQLAQVEVEREQQLAQIRVAEQNQAQQRAEQAARAAQDLKSANLLSTASALAVVIIAVAVASGVIFGAVAFIGSRLRRTRRESLTAKVAAQSKPAPGQGAQTQPVGAAAFPLENATSEFAMPQRDKHEYWKNRRIQARANEVALREMHLDQTPVKYQDLPLAVIKDDSTSKGTNPPGRASNA